MTVPFATSRRSSVGVEWELMLADERTGDLVPRAPEILAAVGGGAALERHTITGELLTNTIEVTSGVGDTVAAVIDDIADAIAEIRTATDPRGIALLCAGSHPFAQWYEQGVTDKTRYHKLIERTQWWGRNMMIWGIHVHVGVEDVNKVFPIIGALTAYLPHMQALSASSPFWAGERTGYASNRALVFQQLPTAGLPWPLTEWSQYEAYLDDMVRTGVMEDATEVRWDIRPAPKWGTIEVRACDGMSTLPELAAVAALVQVLVEHFSRELDAGRELPTLQPWFVRENKWRAGALRHPGADHRRQERHPAPRVGAPAGDDRCPGRRRRRTALRARTRRRRNHLDEGGSSARQLLVADAADGDLRAVVHHLIGEFRAGPALHEHLASRLP